MNPLNTPPPIPAMIARSKRVTYGVSGFWTAIPHPTSGKRKRNVLIQTSLRVPMTGGRNIQTSRRLPPARPGIAVSQ